MASIENEIMAALKARLSTLTWAKLVEYEVIRSLWTDLNESSEIPAIQIYDRPGQPAQIQHQRMLINVVWPLTIEFVLKSTSVATVNQGELFDKKAEIEAKLSENLSLGDYNSGAGIDGFQHIRYDGFETDLHSTPGYFGGFLYFSALFSKPFPGC